MTGQMRWREVGSGEFVTAEYAAEHPGTTVPDYFGEPHPLDLALAEIVRLTDSVPSLTINAVPGVVVTGSNPQDVYEQALMQIRAKLEEMNG